MPPKKASNQPSVKILIDRINLMGDNIRSRSKRTSPPANPSSPPKKVQFVEPVIPDAPKPASNDPADNSYAQEIFMYKTNVHDVASEVVLRQDGSAAGQDSKIRRFKRKLYRLYAKEPKSRIRTPLDRIRFESEYYEYRFWLALNKPLHSDEEYQEYRRQLTGAGVDESWVSMRNSNRLLVYEDNIAGKLKSRFPDSWSMKLDKLDYYLMDMHSKQPVPKISKPVVEQNQPTKLNTTEADGLLEQILEHSSAKHRYSAKQIRKMFPRIRNDIQQSNAFEWLIFDNDELNKRYQLGPYRPKEPDEAVMEVDVPVPESNPSTASQPSSVASGDSEIAQMRSEMAMTQPRELTQLEMSRFVDTQALVRALDQPETLAEKEATQRIDEAADELNAVEVAAQELSPMITPGQAEVIEVSDSPVRADEEEVQIKEEFFYTLDYMRRFTSIDQCVMDEMKQKYPTEYENKMRKLDVYVERCYNRMLPLLLTNTLPKEVRILSRKERKELAAKRAEMEQQLNPSEVPSTISEVPSSISEVPSTVPTEVSPITETPSVPRVPRKSRIIVYEEDEDDVPQAEPSGPIDTLPMPNSEEFLPTVFSTQLPNEVLAPPVSNRRDTPFSSPSRLPAPLHRPQKSPRSSTRPATTIVLPPIDVPTESIPIPRIPDDFSPSVSSTQHLDKFLRSPARRRDTPITSPTKSPRTILQRHHPQPPTPSSRVPTPAFDSSSLNATVISNKNAKSPQKTPQIKRELNTTSYEGEVEFVAISNDPIPIDDTIDQSVPDLLEREGRQPSCMVALPDNLRGMVSTLFRENRDVTLSQGSGTTSSSGGASGEVSSQAQLNTSAPSVGFHQASASQNVRKSQ